MEYMWKIVTLLSHLPTGQQPDWTLWYFVTVITLFGGGNWNNTMYTTFQGYKR
jgi:hypothetical protein